MLYAQIFSATLACHILATASKKARGSESHNKQRFVHCGFLIATGAVKRDFFAVSGLC